MEPWQRKWEGDCYGWVLANVQDGDEVVHGTVAFPLTGVRGEHAWIERAGRVYDNNLDNFVENSMSVSDYYRVMQAEADDRYADYEAQVYALRTGHKGPWTKGERGSRPHPPRGRFGT